MRLSNHLLLGLASLAALGAATTTTTETETTTTTDSDTTTTTSSEDSSVDPGSLTTTTTATTTLTETTTTTTDPTTSQDDSTSQTVTVTTNTDTTASTTSTTSTSATTSQPTISGFPEFSNNFKFLGCVGSTENYPTFFLASTDRRMTIDRCTRVCRGFDYAGLHEDGCFCGRAIDGSRTRIVPIQECNIPCPGNNAEICGGNLLLGISRRQAQPVPNYFRLTVYISTSIIPPPLTTTTTTGHPHPTHVHCHDGRCEPIIIILKPHRGEDCRGEIVYEKIVCNRCDHGHDWVPIRCVDDRCHGKTVYKPEECTRDCGNHIIVEKKPCNDCDGGVVYKPKHTVTVVPPASTRTHHHESKEHTVTLAPPTTTVVPPTSTQRGNPNERIIVTPTQGTTTSTAATSVPENHVIVSGTGRTNVSMLSAVSAVVFGLFFF